jgi:PAS domain S-box-containing protein
MTPDPVFDLIIRGSYLLLAALALFGLIRHRTRARLDIAIPFVTLGLSIFSSILRDLGFQPAWLRLVSALMLLPQPYYFLRLLKYFREVPKWIEWATIIGAVLSCLAVLVASTPLPPYLGIAIVVYFVLAQGYTVVSFVLGARHTRGVTRSQLLLVAAGSGIFALIILLAGLGTTIQRIVPSSPIIRIGAILAALSYFLGFSSPRWLRQIWQRTELHRFLRGEDQPSDIEGRPEAIRYLRDFAVQTVGGQMALVALWDHNRRALMLQDPEGKAEDIPLPADGSDAVSRAWRDKKPVATMKLGEFGEVCRERAERIDAHALYVVPMTYGNDTVGLLLVFLRGALFPEDDLDILKLLAGQKTRTLRYLDLIERLETEQSLMQALMNNIPDTIYFKDTSSRFTRINQAQARVLGLNKVEDAHGKTDLDFQPAELARTFMDEEQNLIKTGQPIINRVEFNPLPGGEPRWFSATKVPLKDPSGAIVGIIGVSRDITQAKQDEDRIYELNRDLTQRAEELEAANNELSAFSYSVSHDLRAPLRTIDGFSRILLEDHGDKLPEEGQRYIRLVREGAQQMGRLIDDLLSFSRLGRQPLKFVRMEPADIVKQVVDSLGEDRNGRSVDFRIGDLPACEADPALIRQVYANLLANALKFTRLQDTAIIEVGCNTTNGEHVYYVKDNGAGFDMKYSDKLFGVFQRLHRAEDYEGTGVGLATVQRIIHRHGGKIWADAEVDKGATFHFTLGGDHAHA